jgi:hypothetical protein
MVTFRKAPIRVNIAPGEFPACPFPGWRFLGATFRLLERHEKTRRRCARFADQTRETTPRHGACWSGHCSCPPPSSGSIRLEAAVEIREGRSSRISRPANRSRLGGWNRRETRSDAIGPCGTSTGLPQFPPLRAGRLSIVAGRRRTLDPMQTLQSPIRRRGERVHAFTEFRRSE